MWRATVRSPFSIVLISGMTRIDWIRERGQVGGVGVTNADQNDISIKGRKYIEVTGVSSVESFDVTEFSLITGGGPLRIEGTNLHMKHLDLEQGIVVIEGTLANLAYVSEAAKKKRITKRLFR